MPQEHAFLVAQARNMAAHEFPFIYSSKRCMPRDCQPILRPEAEPPHTHYSLEMQVLADAEQTHGCNVFFTRTGRPLDTGTHPYCFAGVLLLLDVHPSTPSGTPCFLVQAVAFSGILVFGALHTLPLNRESRDLWGPAKEVVAVSSTISRVSGLLKRTYVLKRKTRKETER